MTVAPTSSEPRLREFSVDRPHASFPEPYRSRTRMIWDFWMNVESFHQQCQAAGDRFVIRLPGSPPMLGLSHPDDIRAVFTGRREDFSLGDMVKRTAPHEKIFGPEIVAEGPGQVQRRQMLNPHFHGKALERLAPLISERVERALRDWPVGREVPFQHLIQPVVMDIIVAVIFGISEGERAARISQAAHRFLRALGSKRFMIDFVIAMARNGEWRGNYAYLQAAMDGVDSVIGEEIEDRRTGRKESGGDLLDAFLSSKNEEGHSLPDQQVFNAMRGLLAAGYDTTAMSMTWLMERLARHPDVLDRLYSEIDGGQTEYVEAVVYEGLRARSPLAFTGRMIMNPTRINDVELQPGVLVAPMMWLTHHRPDIYPEPQCFNPDRFHGKRPDKYAWIPFGGGSRICLGMPLALLELNVFVRTIFSNLRIVPTDRPGERIRRRGGIVLAPSEGALITFAQR